MEALLGTLALLACACGVWLVVHIRGRRREIKRVVAGILSDPTTSVVLPPEEAMFNGADKDYGRVKCRGVILATEGQVVFYRLFGEPIVLASGTIVAAEKKRFFHTYGVGGRKHLVLQLRDGNRLAFYVHDCDHWISTLIGRRTGFPDQSSGAAE